MYIPRHNKIIKFINLAINERREGIKSIDIIEPNTPYLLLFLPVVKNLQARELLHNLQLLFVFILIFYVLHFNWNLGLYLNIPFKKKKKKNATHNDIKQN